MTTAISLIVPYYRQPQMLRLQLANWHSFHPSVRERMRLIIVDDGSPEPALDIVQHFPGVSLYRILTDIPWNRGGARNLGSQVATTPWLLHVDTDHILPADQADTLMDADVNTSHWYRFQRWRFGAADDTRKKDACDPAATFAEIKPHGDSYLCTRRLYWTVGGYDEDYSGCLGGGTPFLEQMEATAPVEVLPVRLHVYTRSVCPDASISTLSRDTSEYKLRRKMKRATGNTKARNPLRFKWEKLL